MAPHDFVKDMPRMPYVLEPLTPRQQNPTANMCSVTQSHQHQHPSRLPDAIFLTIHTTGHLRRCTSRVSLFHQRHGTLPYLEYLKQVLSWYLTSYLRCLTRHLNPIPQNVRPVHGHFFLDARLLYAYPSLIANRDLQRGDAS